MIFQIPHVLSDQELEQVRLALSEAEFIDGKLTAGWYAKEVKHNRQVQGDDGEEIRALIKSALLRHPLFQAAVRPKHIHSLLLSRYEIGMDYGRHTDNALMGQYRSDVSFTVFLSEPDAYQGGELVMEGADDEQCYKYPAGAAIAYPASTLHRVNPVTSGVRLAAVGWVQSWVKDPAQREILFDLDTVRRSLYAQSGKTDEFDLLCKSLANLIRRWSV
ncbi:Fe2+-dependent dioxygenase [Leptolyngbya iicbica]|uniref:Fe2+-dependent dioxygenase n=2 Tax=Cyanophyceae TaxID=3028117 RepID=A0A4V2E2R3_9CYAN|nr:Fe2+-dependent dioxygenase [Leptolyngbya sp. LK]RZM79456.1 Fe2+-dependent dioxygenase [Leptolyngbya sp. LK]